MPRSLRRSARIKAKEAITYKDPSTESEESTDNETNESISSNSSSSSAEQRSRQTECICDKPNDNRIMICCDKCFVWYHHDCVKLTVSKVNVLSIATKDWLCPSCKRKQSMPIIRKLKRKRRKRSKSRNSPSNKRRKKTNEHSEHLSAEQHAIRRVFNSLSLPSIVSSFELPFAPQHAEEEEEPDRIQECIQSTIQNGLAPNTNSVEAQESDSDLEILNDTDSNDTDAQQQEQQDEITTTPSIESSNDSNLQQEHRMATDFLSSIANISAVAVQSSSMSSHAQLLSTLLAIKSKPPCQFEEAEPTKAIEDKMDGGDGGDDSSDDLLIQAGDKWVDSGSFLDNQEEFKKDIALKRKDDISNATQHMDSENEEDDELVVLNKDKKSNQNMCPLTLKEIVDPIRNQMCSHVYERSAILNYRRYCIENDKAAKCPQGGCPAALFGF